MEPSWSIHNPHDPHAVARLHLTAGEYTFWRTINPSDEAKATEDWTTLVTGLTRSTALPPEHITSRLFALETLDHLPQLRKLVEETWVLDMRYLATIDRAVATAPQRLKDDPYFWEILDQDLITRLAPTRTHQLLPAPRTFARLVATTIAILQTPADHPAWPPVPEPDPPPEPDPGEDVPEGQDAEGDPGDDGDTTADDADGDSGEDNPGDGDNETDGNDSDGDEGAAAGPQPCVDPAELMRSLPPLGDTPAPGLWIDTEDNATIRFELSVDQATGTLIRDAIWQIAQAGRISQARAMVMLILGQATTSVTTHLYTAKDVAGAPVFHPLAGVLTEHAAQQLLGLATRATDMDAAVGAHTDSYTPTAAIRAFLVGRDWVCRWPGCTTPAVTGDNDHRVNHEEGGPTTAANMVMLCRHHHNRKTDVQARYLLDPVTGDVFWLFVDGTWAVDHAEGPLARVEKRWVQTYAQRRRRRGERAEARAAAARFQAYQDGAEARAKVQAEWEEAIAQDEVSNNPDPPETTEEPGRDPPSPK